MRQLDLKPSELIEEAYYNNETCTLAVLFTNKTLFHYFDVDGRTIADWLTLANLPKGSVGSVFYGLVREKEFKFKKIELESRVLPFFPLSK